MRLIWELPDHSACVAWSPDKSLPDLVAVGSKDSGRGGFDSDHASGTLQIHNVLTNVKEVEIKVPASFTSLAWIPYENVIVGGMNDGSLCLWKASDILDGRTTEPFQMIKETEKGITAIEFSPLNSQEIAFASADGNVFTHNLATKLTKKVGAQKTEVTCLAWNTQVQHILASGAADGHVTVWDTNQNKPWCELRESAGQAVANIEWNPVQGLHLLTASTDDRNPVIKMWDLGASTSVPLATLSGHQGGILHTSWCPHDDTLLLSCAKDNRTFLWDLVTFQPIEEIPVDSPVSNQDTPASPTSLFAANSLAEHQHMRFKVHWSPIKRGVAITCSLDRKLQAFSVVPRNRPPKWMQPGPALSTGFGGALLFSTNHDKVVTINTVVEEEQLVNESMYYEAMARSFDDLCAVKREHTSGDEKELWGFMEVIFAENARLRLLQHLGYNAEHISTAALNAKITGVETKTTSMDHSTQETIKRALIVGNFEVAVEACFAAGNMADALVLACCGGGELWNKTQERFLAAEGHKRPYLSLVDAIVGGKFDDLVSNASVRDWKETLAILATYGASDEFPRLCVALGDKLSESGHTKDASLCYMCALNLEKTVGFWTSQVKQEVSLDLLALHNFVVKVSVFLDAIGTGNATLSDVTNELFLKYSKLLADQGLFEAAAKYARGDSDESRVLRDRLYRSRCSAKCLSVLGSAPEFPYSMVLVEKSRGQVLKGDQNEVHHQQHASHAQQLAVPKVRSDDDQLLPGWIALQDPSSGQTYYANQMTGESTWDKPTMAPATLPRSDNVIQENSLHSMASQSSTTPSTPGKKKSTLASKYGDGFVTSASHPELAYQYGNVGTSNPYSGVDRPGTAVVNGNSVQPQISGDWNFQGFDITPEIEPIYQTFDGFINSLKTAPLSTSDKRQLAEAEKGSAILIKRMARGDFDATLTQKVMYVVGGLANRDYAAALHYQTDIVNTDWRDHKDWLKGLKALIQLSQKIIQNY